MRGRKAFLLGYHGRRNIGDDAICVSLIETLEKINFKTWLHVYVKEGYVKENCTKAEGLQCHFVSSIAGILKALIDSQIVIIDGGDHIHDYEALLKRLKVFTAFFVLAIATKVTFKRLLIINGGFRVTTSIGLTLLRVILSLANCVSVRDEDSYRLVSKYMSKRLQRGFDTAILLDYGVGQNVTRVLSCHSALDSTKKKIGISVTPLFSNFFSKPEKDELWAKAIARDINESLHNITNINFYFLAFNTDPKVGDLSIIRKIVQMVDHGLRNHVKLIAYNGNVSDFLSKLSQLDAMICCKYHSVIFSYLLGKPMIVINYHPKNAALVHEISLSRKALLSLKDVFNGKLSLMLPELLKNSKEFAAKLPVYEAQLRALNGVQKCIVSLTE